MSGRWRVEVGDCLETLRAMESASVDAVVTDPPYGLAFMGKRWDYDVPSVEVWAECLRVLKPGGHLLAFAGTRTQHRMAVRIEDAGFEIRDMIAWVYASGFPKSLDVSKAIDKAAGAEREVVATRPKRGAFGGVAYAQDAWTLSQANQPLDLSITTPATDAARQWQGWGTALKPALEPITVARKPLDGTVAENVLAHGTGAINVDGCRVGTERPPTTAKDFAGWRRTEGRTDTQEAQPDTDTNKGDTDTNKGRWPANLIHDGSDEVVRLFPQSGNGGGKPTIAKRERNKGWCNSSPGEGVDAIDNYGDSGSAARFFYCAKAPGGDRWDGNHHPTVKPVDLMRYLVRLVTPPGGLVLDPFCGSGSTGVACVLEGFRFVGCEREAEYAAVARDRLGLAERPTTYVPAHAPKIAAAETPPLFAPTESTR